MNTPDLHTLALAAGLGWASGIRLYAVLFLIGLAGRMGWVPLPENLQVLSHPMVMGATGFMLFVEFFADKIPGLDTLWDVVHTFIRIPAGAALAASVAGDNGAAFTVASAIIGGALATSSHLAKTGSRAVINTSPEPVSNWTASLTEDALVLGGLWAAIKMPLLFLAALAVFLLIAIWALPRLGRTIRSVIARLAGRLRKRSGPDEESA